MSKGTLLIASGWAGLSGCAERHVVSAPVAEFGSALRPADSKPMLVPLPEGFTLKDLPPEHASTFQATPYIAAASNLRAAGEEATAKFLAATVEDEKIRGRGVLVLCRMLYEPKPGEDFRRPGLGAPNFLGDSSIIGRSDSERWPLEPITIVDGVPFFVVRGYTLLGRAESSGEYLKYCLDKCVWGSAKYVEKTKEDRAKALKTLIASKTWKSDPSDEDEKILEDQMK